MGACQEVRTWITSKVLVPVTQFITEAREKCEEVRRWVEEKISRPVDEWVSRQERSCRELPWWNPLRWFCEIVTILVKIVVWVVVTVGKWVVTLVCQIVTIVVGIIVTMVLRLIAWLVSFFVCLFTEPLEALKSFRDLWTIVLDTVEDVFGLVTVLLDDVIGILEDIEHLLDTLATSLGWLGVILGILKGIVRFARDLIDIVKDVVVGAKDIVLGIFGFSLCRLLRGLTNLGTSAARALLDTGFAPVALLFGAVPLAAVLLAIRIIGAAAAGVRDTVDLRRLQQIITDNVNSALGEGSVRALRAIRTIGIGANPMGLPFTVAARRLFISSDDRELNLQQMHTDGIINLYALAGKWSDCNGDINEPEGEVVYAGSDLKVSYADLQTFLAKGPGSIPEFHVFAITRARFRSHLETAQRKALALGVQLFLPTVGTLRASSPEHVPLNAGEEDPPGDTVQQVLFSAIGRTGKNDDLSIIPAISHFHYVLSSQGKEHFGLTSWFRPSSEDERISGVTYRNRTPDWVFRWVLIHELGHYLGLNHRNRAEGDRSLDEIMFAPSTGIGLRASAVFEFLLLGGEPRFPLDDARTVWQWITTDGAQSLLP